MGRTYFPIQNISKCLLERTRHPWTIQSCDDSLICWPETEPARGAGDWSPCLWPCSAPGLSNVATAQQPSQNEWRRYVELIDVQHKLSSQGEADASAAAADRARAFIDERFPKRLHFLGIAQVATARQLQARYQESIDLYQEVIKACQDFKPATELEAKLTGPILNNAYRDTAYCLSRLGRHEEAVPYMKQCVQVRAADRAGQFAVEGRNWLPRLPTCKLISTTTPSQNPCFGKPLAFTKAPSRASRSTASGSVVGWRTALSGLAKVHIERARYDLAEPILRRALTLAVDARGWQSATTADVASWLGLVYSMQGMTADALAYQSAAWRSGKTSWAKTIRC